MKRVKKRRTHKDQITQSIWSLDLFSQLKGKPSVEFWMGVGGIVIWHLENLHSGWCVLENEEEAVKLVRSVEDLAWSGSSGEGKGDRIGCMFWMQNEQNLLIEFMRLWGRVKEVLKVWSLSSWVNDAVIYWDGEDGGRASWGMVWVKSLS